MCVRTACTIADVARPRDLPPAMLRFRVSESLSIPLFRNVGLKCAMLIEESVALDAGARVLDFGCGCGRTMRWMLDRHPAVDFTGVDRDFEAIDWCRTAFPRGEFHATQPAPPHFHSAITHSTPCIAFRCSLIWMKPRRIGGWESLRACCGRVADWC